MLKCFIFGRFHLAHFIEENVVRIHAFGFRRTYFRDDGKRQRRIYSSQFMLHVIQINFEYIPLHNQRELFVQRTSHKILASSTEQSPQKGNNKSLVI